MSESDLSDERVKKRLSWHALDFIESPSSRVLGFAIMSLVAAAALFLVFALAFDIEMKVDANGQINSSAGVKQATTSIDGVVESIEVKEGQSVRKDQVLARMKIPGSDESELVGIKSQIVALQKQLAGEITDTTIRARVSDPDVRSLLIDATNKIETLKFRKTRGRDLLQKELAPLNKHMKLLTKQISDIDKSRDRSYLLAQRATLEEERLRLSAQIASLQSSYNATLQSAASEATQSLGVALARVELLQNAHLIRAPLGGTVAKLLISAGSTVRSQTAVAMIIPESAPMIAEVYVQPMDFSRIRSGAKVIFSVDAYPWSQFGHFSGAVSSVERLKSAASELAPESGYLVKVKIDGPLLKRSVEDERAQPMTLVPGMKVEARIVWKRGNLLYLLKESLFGDRL